MPETGWVQLDGFRTREQFRISPWVSGAPGLIQHDHSSLNPDTDHNGIISTGDFLAEVYYPALDQEQDPDSSQAFTRRVSLVNIKAWRTTSRPGGIPGQLLWESAMQVWASTAGVVDYNPLLWMSEKAIEERDAYLAANPTVTSAYVEWEVNPYVVQPVGTYANRTVEVDLDHQSVVELDREGEADDPTTEETISYPHGLVALPRTEPQEGTLPTVGYDDALDWWQTSLETYFNALAGPSLVEAGAEGEILEDSFTDSVLRVDLDDAWWEANAYRVGHGYESLGMPLVLGPTGAILNDSSMNPAGDIHVIHTTYGYLFFEVDWTPPRYRIVYSVDPVVEPVRQFQRTDGLALAGPGKVFGVSAERLLGPP